MAGDPYWNNVVLAMHMDDVVDPLVIGLGQVVGVTDTQLDDLFVLASTL